MPSEIKIFLACSFPPSKSATRIQGIGEALGLRISAADQPVASDIVKKVRSQIFDADGVLFLYERQSNWLQTEFGIAAGMNKVIGVVHLPDATPPDHVSPSIGKLKISGVADDIPSLVSYLLKFITAIGEANATLLDIASPSYLRRRLRHKSVVEADGRVTYYTFAIIESRIEHLTDVTHSIYYNYSLCSPTDLTVEPELTIQCEPSRSIEMTPLQDDSRCYSWLVNFDPALRLHEVFEYTFSARFQHYLPLTRDQLRLITPNVEQDSERIEHHYHISNPTSELELVVDFEDGTAVGECQAVTYFGRTLSTRTARQRESADLQRNLAVDPFSWQKRIELRVRAPQLGKSYGFVWSPKR